MGLKLAACKAFRYELPLTRPLRFGGQSIEARAGFIIRLEEAKQHCGHGEVAPFPGLHRESLEDVWRQWRDLQPVLPGMEWPADLANLTGRFEQALGCYALYPTLRYGLETALLNLAAAVAATTLAGLLQPVYPRCLPVNALIVDGMGIQNQIERLRAEGYETIKLKVGRQALEQDIERVRGARAALGAVPKLRLDANRGWELATAVRFGRAVADCAIDYIEEPLTDPRRLGDFHQATGLPTALDETLVGVEPEALTIPAGVVAFVLKPAALGGLEKTARFIRLARRRGLQSVLSSVFESGVGLAALANVAAARGGDTPAGLDTYRWLCKDVLATPLVFQGGRIDVVEADRRARRLREDSIIDT